MSNYIIFIRLCMLFRKYFLSIALASQYFIVFSQIPVTANGACLVNAGLQVLGTPYKVGALDQNHEEQLISTTKYFDCVTLIEHLLAACLAENQTSGSEMGYNEYLQRIRYRSGKIDGYTSRLHYFSEWMVQQEDHGYLTDITKNAGGIPYSKPIHFMTNNRRRYPKLKSQKDFNDIREMEERLSKRMLYYVPSNKLHQSEKYIQSGDIIAITSNRPGLDVEHTGMAILQQDNIYLLHASSKDGKVAISKKTLTNYIRNGTFFSGIIILRPE
jgi:hypothetical protein